MEGYAAVLSRDGQGGALLREVGKLEKFEDNTINLGEDLLGRPTIERSDGSCSNYVHPWRGCNAGEENCQRESGKWTSSLVRSHAYQWWNRQRRWRDSYRPSAPRT